MIVTVTLNPTLDIIAPVHKLAPSAVMRSENIYSYPGGKGANTARALAALGAGVTAAGFAGNRHAAEMNSFLKKYGIKPDFIPAPGSNRICLLITGKKEEAVINSESNITINAKLRAAFLKKLKKLSAKASVFVFSGSLPLCLPQNFYAGCINAVKNNSTVILDASGKYLRGGMKAGPHIVKVNIKELKTAFNAEFKPPVETGLKPVPAFERFIRSLSKKYRVKTIITTLGKKGSVLFDLDEFHYIKPVKVKKIISLVGSGDAYSAGLAYGIEKEMSMINSCRLGAACAAANLSHEGACFMTKKEISCLLKVNNIPFMK